MKNLMTIVIGFVLLSTLHNCTTTNKNDDQNQRPFRFEDYADAGKQSPAVTPEEAERLIAYVSMRDSTLYVINAEKLQTALKGNLWPSLQWAGGVNASLINPSNAAIPLMVKNVSTSIILMATGYFLDTRLLEKRRKYITVNSFTTDCFDMTLPTPNGDSLYGYFTNCADNVYHLDQYSRDRVYSGKAVQIEHEIFTEEDPAGVVGAEAYLFVQKYYGYTTPDCGAGFVEDNFIMGKWVKTVTGHWPNP